MSPNEIQASIPIQYIVDLLSLVPILLSSVPDLLSLVPGLLSSNQNLLSTLRSIPWFFMTHFGKCLKPSHTASRYCLSGKLYRLVATTYVDEHIFLMSKAYFSERIFIGAQRLQMANMAHRRTRYPIFMSTIPLRRTYCDHIILPSHRDVTKCTISSPRDDYAASIE